MSAFFFWTAWAAATQRPGAQVDLHQQLAVEPLVGNSPTPGTFLWTVFSVLFMLAGIGLLAWHYAVWHGARAGRRAAGAAIRCAALT